MLIIDMEELGEVDRPSLLDQIDCGVRVLMEVELLELLHGMLLTE